MKLIPDWMYLLAIGLLLAGIAGQEVRIAKGETALATEQKAREQETIERQQLVITHANELRAKESQHATDQQQKVGEYEARILAAQTAGAAYRADADRLRGDLSRFTTGATRPGETDAAACQRAKDRLPRVGALLAEGVGLEVESRELIGQRDAEVELLLGQIKADRAACSK